MAQRIHCRAEKKKDVNKSLNFQQLDYVPLWRCKERHWGDWRRRIHRVLSNTRVFLFVFVQPENKTCFFWIDKWKIAKIEKVTSIFSSISCSSAPPACKSATTDETLLALTLARDKYSILLSRFRSFLKIMKQLETKIAKIRVLLSICLQHIY